MLIRISVAGARNDEYNGDRVRLSWQDRHGMEPEFAALFRWANHC